MLLVYIVGWGSHATLSSLVIIILVIKDARNELISNKPVHFP